MNVIGVDPGKTTGIAIYHDSKPYKVAEIGWEEIFVYLNRLEVTDVFVVEDYFIRTESWCVKHKRMDGCSGGFNHRFNHGEAFQVIGAVKAVAAWHNTPVVMQQSAIKPVAAKHSGLPYDPKKKGRGVHQGDAMLHVEHFLRGKGATPKAT